MRRELVHATCVAFSPGGSRGPAAGAAADSLGSADPVAVLLRGPSGAGKSDLALRLIDQGARLVADDQTELIRADGALLARAPQGIRGKMEVRGLGIAELATLNDARVGLVVDLVEGRSVDRLPESDTCTLLDVALPLVRLDPFEASAPAKLRLAVARCGAAPCEPGVAGSPEDRAADPGVDPTADSTGDPGADPGADPGDAPLEEDPDDGQRALILVTGMSGAGRSTALSILEDLGYESIDNLPVELLRPLLAGGRRSLAIGIDIRTRGFAVAPLLVQLEREAASAGLAVTLLFLDCGDSVLGRRYTETRRRHPLARSRPVAEGIAAERTLLAPLRARADLTIDTSQLSPAELRQVLTGHFKRDGGDGLAVCVTSFAYRNGLPHAADLVFDVRFLKNPHYEPELRALSGRDEAVDRFVAADPRLAPFFAKLTDLIADLLPAYRSEGKTYLTIALGCTGGRHRSVAVAERLAAWFAARGETATLLHRDLEGS